ncbi:zinc-ribbon domain-containing protein [Deinococcus aestuarii]|uniref:zinc-ribbon domain-containing protein n=1 Tax=Deinococcus aestuarii TaxID=2774531 RepID=UPI001C0E1CA3|nr:zinc-ribbon domain-containing protein [Deinococcus aestuarii]
MATLEIDCPVCAEVLELTDEDRADLAVGDVIVCDSCNAEMEVTRNAGGEDFELELLGILTVCPNCGEEFDVTDEMLAAAPTVQGADGVEVSVVTCPHCRARIELEFEDDEEGDGSRAG